MKLKGDTGANIRARSLRRSMSLPEVLLWRELRKKPGGITFRRQHPAGPYVLDFFCAPAKLAIEIDGEAHNRGDRPRRDAQRDRWLVEQGIGIMRISAADVLSDLAAIVDGLVAAANDALRPPPRPAVVPLPR